MNDFDQRWRVLTARADEHGAAPVPDLPPHFTARVLAKSRDPKPERWEDLLVPLGLRALWAAGCLCLISGTAALTQIYEIRMDRPALEQSFTRVLPWP